MAVSFLFEMTPAPPIGMGKTSAQTPFADDHRIPPPIRYSLAVQPLLKVLPHIIPAQITFSMFCAVFLFFYEIRYWIIVAFPVVMVAFPDHVQDL